MSIIDLIAVLSFGLTCFALAILSVQKKEETIKHRKPSVA